MKILHFPFGYAPDPPGGTEAYVRGLCAALRRARGGVRRRRARHRRAGPLPGGRGERPPLRLRPHGRPARAARARVRARGARGDGGGARGARRRGAPARVHARRLARAGARGARGGGPRGLHLPHSVGHLRARLPAGVGAHPLRRAHGRRALRRLRAPRARAVRGREPRGGPRPRGPGRGDRGRGGARPGVDGAAHVRADPAPRADVPAAGGGRRRRGGARPVERGRDARQRRAPPAS